MTEARIVWNPAAGGKRGVARPTIDRDGLVDLLARHGIRADIRETTGDGDATRFAQEAADAGCDLVIAAGGDGTVHEAADGLLGHEVPLAILPLGSVMNVARSLAIPRDLEAAAAVIAAGSIRAIDVGVARERVFYEAGSVGMNAAMFKEAQRFDRGDWLSIVRTIWVAFRYRPARMTIQLDDRVIRTRALMVSVSNGPYTGAGMTVAPDARLDDGRFDVRIFRRFSKWQLVRHLASIAFGRRRYAPEVSTHRSARVAVESVHPLPCRADSVDLGSTPITFEVRPAALRVVVPPSGWQSDGSPNEGSGG